MNRGNRKCPRCGLVTWADSAECAGCRSAVSTRKNSFISRIRVYLLVGLGCATVFGVYRYVHRPLPPTDEDLRPVFQSIAESHFTSTARINRGTNELSDVVTIRPGWYQLQNPELSEEDGVYSYSADFSLQTSTNEGQPGPAYRGRIKLTQIEGKWKA